jgi:hypothetical protein
MTVPESSYLNATADMQLTTILLIILNIIVTLQLVLIGTFLFLLLRREFSRAKIAHSTAGTVFKPILTIPNRQEPPTNSQFQAYNTLDSRIQIYPVDRQTSDARDRAHPAAHFLHHGQYVEAPSALVPGAGATWG